MKPTRHQSANDTYPTPKRIGPRGRAVVREPGRQVGQAEQAVDGELRRDTDTDEEHDEGREHRQHVRGDAGETVVRVEVDEEDRQQHRQPRDAGEPAADGFGEALGGAGAVEQLAHPEQSAVPDEHVPGGALGGDRLPGHRAGREQHRQPEQRDEGDVEAVPARGHPEHADAGEDGQGDPFVASERAHVAELRGGEAGASGVRIISGGTSGAPPRARRGTTPAPGRSRRRASWSRSPARSRASPASDAPGRCSPGR